MRRTFGFVAVAVAVFALASAALLAFYVPDKAKKTPLDLNVTLYGNGSGQYFDSAANKLVPVTLRSVRHVRTDTTASTGSVIVVDQGICIMRDAAGRTTCSLDPKKIVSAVLERIAASRTSALSVKGFRSPADHSVVSQLDGKDVAHEGLTLKFPFDAKKHSYPFWDYNLERAATANYTGTTKVAGLTAYRYHVVVPKTKVDVVAGVAGFYSDDRTLYVEPQTGTILESVDHQLKNFANGSVAAQIDLSTDQQSIQYQANKARDGINEINAVSETWPIVLLVVGVVIGVLAFVLLRGAGDERSGVSAHRASREPQPVATG